MRRSFGLVASFLVVAAVLGAGCGSDSKKTPTTVPSVGATSRPIVGATTSAAAVSSPVESVTSAATRTVAAATPAPNGQTYTATQAQALVDDAPLRPGDVALDWQITSDTTTDNAAAAAADPTSATSFERCGRLTGRVLTNGPKDVVSSYLNGSLVAAFTQLTVYATAAGAADCAAEAASRFQKPGELARAFGTVFLNPDAVVVNPVDYPTVGDGSFASTLTGDISAAGTVVQLQILIVAFLKGNVSGVVGVATLPMETPVTDQLKPLVEIVLSRIGKNQ